jgi:hypothetical protein
MPIRPITINMKDKAMSTSGYDRIANDAYFTIEEWCTEALFETFKDTPDHFSGQIWEPACGSGLMAEGIKQYNPNVTSSDIYDWGYGSVEDFMDAEPRGDHIVTNPPYEREISEPFVRRAVDMVATGDIKSVSVLMRNEWDCAHTRRALFGDCDFYAGKIVLTKRPRWFEKRDGDSSPRHNYAWFHWRHDATDPVIRYYHPSMKA